MEATDFEFRARFAIIFSLLAAAFALYVVDPVSTAEALSRMAARGETSPDRTLSLLYIFGGAIIATGALIRTWATAYLRADVVHDPSLHAKKLVADGPYRRLRNPLYLGVFLLALGAGFAASRLGCILLLVTISLYLYRLVRREEAELFRTQGESYAQYHAAVPSFIPAVVPRLPAGGAVPRWAQSLKGELFIWLYASAEILYGVTFRKDVALVLVAAGFLANAYEVYGPGSKPAVVPRA